MTILQKCYQKSVDMGLKLEENMYGWVVLFISGPHTPLTFLVFSLLCPSPLGKIRIKIVEILKLYCTFQLGSRAIIILEHAD